MNELTSDSYETPKLDICSVDIENGFAISSRTEYDMMNYDEPTNF